MPPRHLLPLLAALLIPGLVPAQKPQPKPGGTGGAAAAPADARAAFTALKASFARVEDQAKEEARSGREAAEHTFLAFMQDLLKSDKVQGDLEKTVTLADEIKSFEFSHALSGPTVLAILPELKAPAAELDKGKAMARKNGALTYGKSAPAYLKRLLDVETAALRKGEAELAADARAERQRVEADWKTAQEALGAAPGDTLGAGGDPTPKPTPATKAVLPAFTRMLKPLESKILFYLSFDQDWGKGPLVETSGLGIPCSHTNVVYNARGKRGGAADMNNKAEIILPRNPAFQKQEALSFSFWFRTREARSSLIMTRFDPEETEDPPFAITLRQNGRLSMIMQDSRANSSRDQLNNNNWHHVVAVKTATDMTLYLDGEFAGKGAAKVSHADVPTLYLGYEVTTRTYHSSSGEYEYSQHRLNGTIDEFVIFNTALTPQDVKTIFQSQK